MQVDYFKVATCMLLVECSISKCGNGRYHHRSNQGVSLDSGSFSVDQFYKSIVCMREIEVLGGVVYKQC